MVSAAHLNTQELMEIHIRTLYLLNEEGRLVAVNEMGNPPPPIFFMGRTLEGNFWHFRHDLPDALVAELDRLCRAEPVAAQLGDPPQQFAAIHALLDAYLPREQPQEYRGPAYWIPELQANAENVVLLSAQNAHLVRNTFPSARRHISNPEVQPIVVAVEQDQAVTLCYSARRPDRATEAGVETLPEFRGKGYATATVAAWATEVSKRGCIPLYSTSWENTASQAIARKLGMVIYGEDWSIQ